MNIIYIAAAAFGGGIVSSILGWLDSQEGFDPRKFAASLVKALVAGIGFAVAYTYANSLSPLDLGIAFLGGAGFDSTLNRITGAVKAGIGK